MKKINKVSVSDFEKSAKGVERTIDVDWAGVAVTVTPTLSLTEMLEFVHSVVESCFSDDGEYIPEVKDFAVYRNVLERYANFRLPVDVDKCYALIYGTDAVEFVLGHINEKQWHDMIEAIEEKIQFRLDSMADSMRAKMEEFLGAMNALQEQTKHVFDGMSEEDMKKLVGAIEQGGLSEEKLVAAYLDQKKEPEENTEG
jgi:hypothetical protein